MSETPQLALLGHPPRSAFFQDELESMAKNIGWSTVSNTGITDWQPELEMVSKVVYDRTTGEKEILLGHKVLKTSPFQSIGVII